MRVEQAIYGEVNRGHGLRAVSPLFQPPVELASKLDLPNTAPLGAEWSPYLSGFRIGDRYVLARTFHDPRASRSGMVLSHALVAPLEEIIHAADLRPLIGYLIASVEDMPEELQSIELSASGQSTPRANDLNGIAQLLSRRPKGTVVRIGHTGFDDLVAALWFHLWPALRRNFSFRLSFGPDDLHEQPAMTLVCTPASLRVRWDGRKVLDPEAPTVTSLEGQFFTGARDPSPLLAFAHSVGARTDNFDEIPILIATYEAAVIEPRTVEACISTIRGVQALIPAEAGAEQGRALLVDELIALLPRASISNILLLRNFNSKVIGQISSIWSAIHSWASSYRFIEPEDGLAQSAIKDALAPNAVVPEWSQSVLDGFAVAATREGSGFASAFWRWTLAPFPGLESFLKRIPAGAVVEAALVATCPLNLFLEVGEGLLGITAALRWLNLHARVASACLDPSRALQRQLEVDAAACNLLGIEQSIHRATPREQFALAVQGKDLRLVKLAGKLAASHPDFLQQLELEDPFEQDVWAEALAINPDAWRGPADPQVRAFRILDQVVAGEIGCLGLVRSLSLSPLADLTDYDKQKRASVWLRLANPSRDNFLAATVAAWMERARTLQVLHGDMPETDLESAILTDARLDDVLLEAARTSLVGAVNVIALLRNFDERRFVSLLRRLASARVTISDADSTFLGTVIEQRNWSAAVDELLELARNRTFNARPALNVCRHMLSFFSRAILGLGSISNDELWRAFADLAANLYPQGPSEQALWSRAGGRSSDLPTRGSGAELWYNAIQLIRNGKPPRVEKLLKEMKIDFSNNPAIDYLIEQERKREMR